MEWERRESVFDSMCGFSPCCARGKAPDDKKRRKKYNRRHQAEVERARRQATAKQPDNPRRKQAPWADLISLMPVVDGHDEEHFVSRLRLLDVADLCAKAPNNGNTALLYAVEKSDDLAVKHILDRVAAPALQVKLIDDKNDAGLSAGHAAVVSHSSARFEILKAFDKARRAAAANDDAR